MGWEIAYKLTIPTNADRHATSTKIFELKDMLTKIFVVHMTFKLGTLLFLEA